MQYYMDLISTKISLLDSKQLKEKKSLLFKEKFFEEKNKREARKARNKHFIAINKYS